MDGNLMDGDMSGNTMTEIALALAMGFFSIMVLTMVSMGAGSAEQAKDASKSIDLAAVAPAPSSSSTASDPQRYDLLVVLHQGEFLDEKLNPIAGERLQRATRIILAVSPDTSTADAVAARSRIKNTATVITPLDRAWVARLAQQPGK